MTETAASITRGATQSVSAWFKGQKIEKKDDKPNAVPDKESHPGLIKKGTEIKFNLYIDPQAEIEAWMKDNKGIYYGMRSGPQIEFYLQEIEQELKQGTKKIEEIKEIKISCEAEYIYDPDTGTSQKSYKCE